MVSAERAWRASSVGPITESDSGQLCAAGQSFTARTSAASIAPSSSSGVDSQSPASGGMTTHTGTKRPGALAISSASVARACTGSHFTESV